MSRTEGGGGGARSTESAGAGMVDGPSVDDGLLHAGVVQAFLAGETARVHAGARGGYGDRRGRDDMGEASAWPAELGGQAVL